MNQKGISKILVGICLVLVLILALPLVSACQTGKNDALKSKSSPSVLL